VRIAMIHSSFAIRGGAEQYVRDLSRDLALQGHEVRVFCRASDNSEPVDHHVGRRVSARLGGASPKLQKVFTHLGDLVDPTGLSAGDLAEFAPDVVHVHNWQGLGILPLARLARTYPTCHTVHDYAIADPNNALANRGRSRLADTALDARSAWLVRRLRRVSFLWPAQRTRDILRDKVPAASGLDGSVVPLAVFTGRGPRPTWRPGTRNVFLYMGALSPHKGVDLLLDAWRTVPGGGDRVLLVAGDGALRGAVGTAAAADPSIRYLGYLDAAGKTAAIQEAGWLVFPSQWAENFPISCVEALMAGRPIITSTVARPPMASDGSVLTFDSRDALAAVLGAAADMSADRYGALAASAAADGHRLDWDDHVAAVVAAYNRLRTAPGAKRP
jgi:glycosyltransferase involved in cell wall biosynthesis